ncbi:hypothetical protein BAUCODRAFT_309149 [Baudoinia panamericana UAMH 10762]|uniref:Tetratricopeptide repeat domain-containing protein n=1 Tax=Baudoinia panamericana (strain UAMH 10762) TaxID=717646 RepID=M2MYW6_BAUPA|nr:uncharacterized protein BAUCODRAFT_309149 [Baudoinia panamericana UAMH 10762]EMC91874.1 hypothetical protein BAUCODRAFT_309149 [Baudoinia panamericana UAMH 10762]
MPYVKAVPLSRIAGQALKSFTHGYAQTVVAASQSSYAAQNPIGAGPLSDALAGRFRKAEKSRVQNVAHHAADGARPASTVGTNVPRPETSHHDGGLEKYFDAWQKHQRNGTKEWQQFQFARRLEWQPPSTVPLQGHDIAVAEAPVHPQEVEQLAAPSLKRSYTTSALDNFSKAFINDEAAEADALEQVNIAIAEEIQRSRDDAEGGLVLKSNSASSVSQEQTSATEEHTVSTPATLYTSTDSFSSAEADFYSSEILELSAKKEYERVPAAFQAMLRAGVQQPKPATYHALLTSVVELTQGKHQKVPKALEVYSDMLRRKVTPHVESFNLLISLLARRASEALALRQGLEDRLVRYGGLEEPGKFMFRSAQSEHRMLVEDSSLSIALKLFDRATRLGFADLSSGSYTALIIACAEQGRVDDMKHIYQHSKDQDVEPTSSIYPSMIAAYGLESDLKSAVEIYDEYKQLAVEHNAGLIEIARLDNEVYAALVKAYGSADRLKGGLKFLAGVQATTPSESELLELRETVALQALLPLALKDGTLRNAIDLTNSLTGRALSSSLAVVVATAADRNMLETSQKAFDALARVTQDLAVPATAMLAMHIRNANAEGGEPYWRILESAPAQPSFIEPSTMRTVALIGLGEAERGLRQARRMFARVRDQQPETAMAEAVEQIDEALELIGNFLLKNQATTQPQASAELLRMMVENGGLTMSVAEHVMARLSVDQIARLPPADLELMLRIQGDMIIHKAGADIAGPARFGCMLEALTSRSIRPATETENAIEKTLVNIARPELSRLWTSYRYPQTPVTFTPVPFTPVLPYQAPAAPFVQPAMEDTYDPYAARTDVKGSTAINDLLERSQGRRMSEALTKFRNMRRVGRVPRMFTYGKLIEAAAKENNLNLAHDILEMAKQDVAFDARYRVVRFGWQQILDHMIAGCLTVGRRDLAARYHQDLVELGMAPSANTFGLYITTLKENTKTFDEASEAVKIFLRAKTEGVEPSSFLYNALIGKLGKARRIDDCLFYFAEMRNLGIRPTSVTYGTIVNALCRVSDDKFAEEIFEEMETQANYKPRPAPYHSLMQFFLTTKRDRGKVLAYYERMRTTNIEPTIHTYKLLIDTYATLEPVNLHAAEVVLTDMQASGITPEAVHYSSLQAMFESMNANHAVSASEYENLLSDMAKRGVEYTPYIANALIHGWTLEKDLRRAKEAFDRVHVGKREPSTYEAMVRAHLTAEDREGAKKVVREALGRGYPSAVAGKIADLVR